MKQRETPDSFRRALHVAACLFVGLLLVFSSKLRATEPSTTTIASVQKQEKEVMVGAATDMFPYSFLDGKGELRGFATDVIDAAARVMNIRLKRVSLRNWQLQENFLNGEYDVLECYAQSKTREATCDFSVPFNTLEGTVFIRRNEQGIDKLSDLSGKAFALPGVGSIGEDFLNSLDLNCERIGTSTSIDALRLIEQGKVDATLGARLTVLSLIDRNKLTNIKELKIPVVGFDVRHCFAVHKGNSALLARLNEGLAIIHRTGEYERIYHRWFALYEPSVFTREEVFSYAAAGLFLALVGASWALLKQRALDRRIARQADDLRLMNASLQRATQAKTDFIRTVSHELRNPLAGARMMSDVLRNSSLDSKSKDRMDKLHGCVSYLQAVLDETLDLAHIELGYTPTKLTQFKLGDLLAETMSIFESVAAEKNITYRYITGPVAQDHFQGAAMHLKRILINYLSNAFKFTASGSVTLQVTRSATTTHTSTLRFTVADTGTGVPGALRSKIFSTYVRSSEPQLDGSARGAGLGLAVCQKLAELNGGCVGFESEPGKGAHFWVELPLIKVAANEEAAVIFERPDFSAVRTLIVDDESVQRETMSILLQEMGVVPQLASSVDQATHLLQTSSFDLVLADYNLGPSTGIELLRNILRNPGASRPLPVFHLVTGCVTESLLPLAMETGFTGVHRKPFNFAAIYEILAAVEAGRVNPAPVASCSS